MAGNVDLTLRLLFEDQASAGLKKLSGTMLDALSLGAITAFGVTSVKAFADAEAAQRRLQFAFEKFPAINDVTIGSLRDLNTELMRKTGYDDDAIASGQALLAQFKLTGKQIAEVTPLLVDYAAQQGMEIPDAANNLGKALLGNAKALKNIGIAYKSTGNAAQDYANITQLLQEKVGGFAADEAQTAAGSMRRLQTAFENVQEQVGSALAPALANSADGFQAITDQLGPMLDDLTQLTTLASSAATAVMDLTDAAEGLPGAMPAGLLDAFGMGLGSFVTGLLHADDRVEQLKADMEAQGYVFDEATQSFIATGEAARATGEHFGVMGDAAKTSANAVKQLDAALQRIGGRNISIAEATSQLQAAFDAAAEAAKKNGKALSLQTSAGRENRAALIAIAKAADEAASAYAQNGKSADYIRARTKEARAAFIDAAESMGATGKQARELADQYGLVPNKVTTAVTASGIESVLSAASILKQRWQEIINLPTAQLNAHYGVTGTPTHKAMRDGSGPIVYTPPADPVWSIASGQSIGRIAATSASLTGLRGRIADLPGLKALRKQLKDADNDQAKERIRDQIDLRKELTERLRDRIKDMRQELRGQRDDMRADAISYAQAQLVEYERIRDDAKQTWEQAQQTLADLQRQRAEFQQQIADGFRAAASVTTFSFADAEGAAAELFDARRAYNAALGTNEEAAALERLNRAKAEAADADATNTPAGVLANVNKKLASIRSLAANLRKMQAMGYPTQMIRDVLGQGIEGARLAEVLASADPGTVAGFQAAQAGIDAAAADLGAYGYALAGSPLDSQIVLAASNEMTASAAYQTAAAVAAAYANQPLQIQLQMDGRTVVEMLQNYRRSTGGAPLGLG